MVCKRYERLIIDLIAGELSLSEQEKVKKHLKECPECARLFEEYRDILEKVKDIEIPVPDAYVWERKLVEIKEGHRKRISILKPAAAFAVLVLVITLFFVRMSNNGSDKTVVRKINKNGYGIVLTKLPCSEETIIEMTDYMDDESASKILDIVLETPTLPIYEY